MCAAQVPSGVYCILPAMKNKDASVADKPTIKQNKMTDVNSNLYTTNTDMKNTWDS
jgi:hypothetical protein